MNRFSIAGGLIVGLLVGVFAAAAVGAQESTPTPSTVVGDAGGIFDDFKSKLAENLGISTDQLDTALDQTQIDIVDEKLANGDITQEQADAIKERIESGENVPFPFFFGGPHPGIRMEIGLVDSAAEVLGMDVSDLLTELRDDKSLNDVAAEKGLSADDFKTQLLDNMKAKLDQKVTDGDITQEQADNIYARLSENIDDVLNNNNFEGRLPFGPHRPGPRVFNDDNGQDSGGTEDSGATESGFF